jgi:protoporphyrinogen oxidase
MKERVLIVGGGISGLAAAGFLRDTFDCLLVEKESEIGGYCRTFYQAGFTWDYSGHFYHFRHQWIAEHLRRQMDADGLLTVKRISRIYLRNAYIDYPFQYNIHQLPTADFVHCLKDMYQAQGQGARVFHTFREMLYGRYGQALADLFLVPYNEKLYAIDIEQLDADAMGRFFPHIEFGTLLAKLSGDAAAGGYNDNFTYHRRGARAYVDGLARYVPDGVIRTDAVCRRIDLDKRRADVGGEWIPFDRMVISAPLPRILEIADTPAPQGLLTANKVLVLNLGFDRPSLRPDHWVYYPEPEYVFFRVGHYDNILGEPRMSLYVEIALSSEAAINVPALKRRALDDLTRAGVIAGHRLVSWTHVVLDPAYVHISNASNAFAAEACARLETRAVHPIGRYGQWKYCSIEDNILDAFSLARSWGAAREFGPEHG